MIRTYHAIHARAVYQLWYSLVATLLDIAEESKIAPGPESSSCDPDYDPRDGFFNAAFAGT